jgi:hypothetical protein
MKNSMVTSSGNLTAKISTANDYISMYNDRLDSVESDIANRPPPTVGDISISTALEGGHAVYSRQLGRNLLTVLGVSTVAEAVEALHKRCNNVDESGAVNMGDPDFSNLRLGDYIDLESLNDGENTYTWNSAYENLRLVIAGFNTGKYNFADVDMENLNHIIFMFKNCYRTKLMHASFTVNIGFNNTDLRFFLDGSFKAGLVTALGIDANPDYLYNMMRLCHKATSGLTYFATVWIPGEFEVHGNRNASYSGMGDSTDSDNLSARLHNFVQFPIFQEGFEWRSKRLNGVRRTWWLQSPYDSSHSFCAISSIGATIGGDGDSDEFGVAPFFAIC